MTRDDLVIEARNIEPPSPSCAKELADLSEIITADVNKAMTDRPDLEKLIGPGNLDMMKDNHANHARFMASLCRNFNPEVLVDTVIWVFKAYRAHGFLLTYWPAQLNCWIKALNRHLSPESFEQINPVYQFMIVSQAAFVRLSDADRP